MSKKDERKRVLPWLACVGRETQLESFDFTNRMKNRCYKLQEFFFLEKRKSKKRKETLELANKFVIVIVEKKTTLTLELVVCSFSSTKQKSITN